MDVKTKRQLDEQIDVKWMDGQTDTDVQTFEWTDTWTVRHMGKQPHEWTNTWMNRRIDRQTHGYTYTWMDKHMDKKADEWIDT